ncbi:DUF3137 domain-containing protein [Luteolibacter marinus]|uniref:DUF3137 domain-containing protein n=1 Tax=Luteolibacter marinus TaxID=2776705 RepID=UPI0018691999|nr:DUF3137 domain-containing protein [Luteolibacter marinus]
MSVHEQLEIDRSRPELAGFDDYYANRISPRLAALASEQRKARTWAAWISSIGLVVTAVLIWSLRRHYHVGKWFEPGDDGRPGWAFWVTAAFVASWLGTAIWKLMELKSSVKGSLLKEVSAFFGFEYEQRPGSHNLGEFSAARLVPSYDRARTEDRFSGCHAGVDFELFECFLSAETGSDEDRGSKQVYHGLLFSFSFPKAFSGQTVVLKDQGRMLNFLKGWKHSGERIKLEDPRFEKHFEVWGTDPIEARYLLTPTFMERVVELAEAFGSSKLELCFRNKRLLISVPVVRNQFEGGGMLTDVRSKKRVEIIVREFTRLFDIVNTLKLNIRTVV